ncbi:MAG: hypothetical protein R3293_16250 [Candidatus Promineifilaceae bacterium]|nr:hypothetical protein [Candidatus Promineifilaceae bacterium]
MTTKLLLYGLQRSGTNYLETLLKRRFQVHILNESQERSHPAHKHFRLYDKKAIIPEPRYYNELHSENFAVFEQNLPQAADAYLIISKNPYSWLISYYRWAQKCAWPAAGHHYIEEYNLFYGRWLRFSRQTKKIQFVRYIDLLRYQDALLLHWQNTLGMQNRFLGGIWTRMIRRVDQSQAFTAEQRDYYIKERYLAKYTSKELQDVSEHLDREVISRLGYKIRK